MLEQEIQLETEMIKRLKGRSTAQRYDSGFEST